MYTELIEKLKFLSLSQIKIFAAGDFNSRFKDLNLISSNISGYSYSNNIDTVTNSHGSNYFQHLCIDSRLMPLNHLIFNNKHMPGKFTYHKAGKKSQIDFILVNESCLNDVIDFDIIEAGWHLSDHLPLSLKIKAKKEIPLNTVLTRSLDLNDNSIGSIYQWFRCWSISMRDPFPRTFLHCLTYVY